MRERVKFEQDPKNVFKGAIGALRDGKADSEDLTATFVAVCRAAKIPARMVWAMDYCYAEFYLEENPPPHRQTRRQGREGKEAGERQKAAKGAWYPCVVHQPVELGVVQRLPADPGKRRQLQSARGQDGAAVRQGVSDRQRRTGGKPAVEFRGGGGLRQCRSAGNRTPRKYLRNYRACANSDRRTQYSVLTHVCLSMLCFRNIGLVVLLAACRFARRR